MASFKQQNEGSYFGHVSAESKKWFFGKRKNSPPKPEGSPDPGGPLTADDSYSNIKAEPGFEGQLSQNSRHSLGHIPLQPSSKQETTEFFNNLTLEDQNKARHSQSSDPLRPTTKRPHHDAEQFYPSKIRTTQDPNGHGSASPFSSRHNHDHSESIRTGSPSGFRSAQRTPQSSPKLNSSHPANVQRQQVRHPPPPPSNQLNFAALQDAERRSQSHMTSAPPTYDIPPDQEVRMLRQPETRPISQEQLVNEVKGIYAGLVMVEKKCVEICASQSQTTNKLSNEQWQALIALHRTLLHEHHDFFLASQHPTASPALRRLPTKYAMPARMWRHGIHSFLELLRHRLPYSLEHMLSFVYLAYQMMGLLMESVPAFYETWIECLGDLARYRMAIEEADMRDRENWSNVARMWYNRAADRSPNTGRIQHHLAVLARPNIVRQLFYYSKALISVNPFINARDSIMLLFSPLLDSDTNNQKYNKAERSLVTAAGIMFTRKSIHTYAVNISEYISDLDSQITRSGSNFKVMGAEIASSLIALMYDFGHDENYLWKSFRTNNNKIKGIQDDKPPALLSEPAPLEDPILKENIHAKFWRNGPINPEEFRQVQHHGGDKLEANFDSSDEVTAYILPIWFASISIVAQKVGDRNILPFMHITLAFIWSSSYVPGALIYLETYVPWAKLVLALNTLSRSGVSDNRIEAKEFPQQQSGTGRQLPEDFLIRGLVWSSYYFPGDFFDGQVVDEDERTLEMPSHAAPRAERCLWLGHKLASLNRYITYDDKTKLFAATDLASSLAALASTHTLHNTESQMTETQ
ncbi:hypothetical protein LTR84_008388 [Exophiala bonariae]|uniref:DNA/RNA-binding domain-containing protein n=1 Tax=Exophiala bonariae TaxID=1690606 RepID=A0AAV9MZ62_9EURO|nr:hypothetical protein LTR84_008388 [Exophiala bonariae]